MSFAEKTSRENDQKEPEICLQEDAESNESDPEDQKDKNMRLRDRLKTSKREKRTVSPLSLFKEDFSQFKEEMLKVFKDKDMKTEDEDCPSSRAENKPAGSTLGLLKDDLNQLKEDITSVFSIGSSKDKETKSAEKAINRLNFLKEDLNHFKDNLSNVFKISPLKERDTAKEESSETFKRKVSKAERTDEAVSLFRRDQKTSPKAENSRGVKKTFSETSEEQMNCVLTGNLSEQKEETVEKIYNNMKDRMDKLDTTVSEETTSLSETQQSKELIPASRAAEDERTYVEEEEEEEEPSETLPQECLSSGINLFHLRDSNRDDMRNQPGDLWSVKNFACYLTFDPNTANSELHLTDGNRKVTRVWLDHRPLDHPDRFERCPQVLCREGLLDSVYWEVMWSGGADIGVTYNSISRDGDTKSCLLGHNKQSWSLECSEGSYTPCHNNKRFRSSSPKPFTHRVGVYLDWSAGSLSFYCISQDTMVHLHTFTSTFTEPVYPGFWVWAYNGSVSLCQVELNWERLLQ